MDPCSIVSNTVSNISTFNDFVITPIKPYVTRPFNYKRKLEELKNEVDELRSERQKVGELAKDAEYHSGLDIKDDVKAWMNEANSQISADEARQVEERKRAKKKCFMGLCPNFITRYQISRNAEKEASAIVQLRGKSSEFDAIEKISCRPAAEATRPVTIEDYEAFESRKACVKEIKDALTGAQGIMIGVCGFGGVGKTTLVKEVARQAMEDKLIDKMVIVDVTEKPDIAKIQEKIAKQLDFKLDEQSEKASRLRTRLIKEEKLLIILDNLWDKLDLKEVGIPFPNEHKGRRILVTSRDEQVLSSMDAKTTFKLQVLNDTEAWDLFTKKAGDVDKDSDLQSVAAQVAQECAGLPVLLVAVASALKGKDLQTWKDALERLKRFDMEKTDKEYSTLRLSYDMLKGDEIKSLFLLCGTIGFEQFGITDLLKYTMGLGLFNYCNTLEKTRNRLHVLVHKLKACCLLLEADWNSDGAVKMHDVVRKFAISVATERDRVLTVGEGSKLEAWPEKNKFKQYTAISLRYCMIPELPTALECPRLKSFMLGSIVTPSLKIADNFFGGMRKLKLMDLTEVHLSPLPSSIKYLENLQTLCLDFCTLDDISVVGLLTNLQVLSMMGSSIVQLPKEIGQLTQLKLLDLSHCTSLEVIAPDLLSGLTALEDLCMENSFAKWEVERPVSQRSNASLAELKQLKNLIALDIHVTDAKMLPKDLFSNELQRFRLFIGEGWDWSGEYETSRTLKLNLNTCTQLGEGLKILLKITEDLYLEGMEGLNNVLYELDMEGFSQLKHLNIQHCHEIQHIINSYGMGHLFAFPRLKSLAIENLSNLEEICHGQLMTESFRNLKVLKVRNCDRLKYLISFSVARSLPQLEEIDVTDCEVMDAIVAEEADDHLSRDSNVEWARLRSLALQSLPQFTSFCSRVKPPSHHNTSTIDNRPWTSRQLSNQKILFPNLEKLKLSSLQVEKLWDRQLVDLSSCSEKLTDLIVESFDNLNHLFTFSMFKSLVRLQKLEIRHCKSMKEIIAIDGLGGEEEREKISVLEVDKCGSLSGKGAGTDYKILFPALKMITLESLPSLTSFYTGKGILEFPSLESVCIEDCPDMKSFVYNDAAVGSSAPLFNDKVVFPKLESLLVTDCESLVELFDANSEPLTQLRIFHVSGLPNLKSLFPASMARGLMHLEELEVDSCGIEEIVQIEEGTKEIIKFEFPRLRSVVLLDLPELQRFYPGPHISECLVLKELMVCRCDKVETFSWEFILGSDSCSEGQNQISLEQPLFLAEKIIPNLESLPLSSKDVAMICQNKYPPHLFRETRLLTLHDFDGESTEFPMALLKRYFSNLGSLLVIDSKFKESSPQELGIGNENQVIVFKELRYLFLKYVHNLSQFWKQDSELGCLLQNLENLDIYSCENLIDLSPFSASFQSLTTLDVYDCNETVNLLTPLRATSLVQLTNMTIRECDAVISVVANEGDESKDEIVFSKLESLTLDCLPSLISFCPENLSLKFPSLVEVNINQCPRMNTFSGGDVGTPNLQKRLIGADGQVQWHGDLNTYVKQLYSELGDAVAGSILPTSPKGPTAQLEKKGSLVASESRKAEHWGVIQKKASIRRRILDNESANQLEPDKENIESALPESTIDRLDSKYEDLKEISKDKDDPTYASDGGEDESDDNPLMGKGKVGDHTEGTSPSEIVKEEAMQPEIALEPNSAASQTSIEGNELEVNEVVVGVSETVNIITHIDDDEMTTAPLAVGGTCSTNDDEGQSTGIDFVSFSNISKATDTPPEILVAPPNAGAHLNVEASNYSLSSTSTTTPQVQDDNVVKEETPAAPSQTRSGVMTITAKSVTVVARKPNMPEVVPSNQEVITAPRGEVEATEEAVLMTASPTATEAATDGGIVVMGVEPKKEKFPANASQTCTGVAMTTRRIVPLTAKPSMPEEAETREGAVPVTTSTTEEAATNGGTIVMATETMILAFSQSVDSGSATPDITSEATQEAAQSSPDESLSQDQVASFIADLLASKSIAGESADVSSSSEIARRLVGLAEQLQQDHQNCSITAELLSAIAELRSSDVTAAQHALLSRIKRSLEDRTQDREDAAKAMKQLENGVEGAQAVQKQSISIFSQQQALEVKANLEHDKLSAEVQALTEEIRKLEAQRMQKLTRMEALDQEKKANATENARLVADYLSRGAHIFHLQAEMEKHQGTFIELEGCLSSLIRLARELQ